MRGLGDAVEMRPHVGEETFAGRPLAIEGLSNTAEQPNEKLIEHGIVECFFVAEVVIQQGFVYTGSCSNGVRARPGQALLGKFAERCLENRGPACLRLAPGSPRAAIGPGSAIFLINQLVRLAEAAMWIQLFGWLKTGTAWKETALIRGG